MSTDRELLEKAAKAAGIDGRYFEGDNPIHTGIYRAGHDYYWNPLISDSEALRLAVKLLIDFKPYHTTVRAWKGDPVAQKVIASIEEVCGADPYAATRRAIVRAAAAIGEKMP